MIDPRVPRLSADSQLVNIVEGDSTRSSASSSTSCAGPSAACGAEEVQEAGTACSRLPQWRLGEEFYPVHYSRTLRFPGAVQGLQIVVTSVYRNLTRSLFRRLS